LDINYSKKMLDENMQKQMELQEVMCLDGTGDRIGRVSANSKQISPDDNEAWASSMHVQNL
jgi:hypothetical protein